MKYQCSICGYIYDDEKEKIPFSKLPDSWTCPMCGAKKSAFKPVEETAVKEDVEKARSGTKVDEKVDHDMIELSTGQLAALFSGLARACEKQYLYDEVSLFLQLSDYYKRRDPYGEHASLEGLEELIQTDLDKGYPKALKAAQEQEDRGAWRACVWGEKNSRMIADLLKRYLEEGEFMLKGLQVWVCTVCGFIYIGGKAPDMCPVCKVPNWKFELMEGRT